MKSGAQLGGMDVTGVSADVDAAGGTASVPSADVRVRTRQSASLPGQET